MILESYELRLNHVLVMVGLGIPGVLAVGRVLEVAEEGGKH
jgi:hypothetical protein